MRKLSLIFMLLLFAGNVIAQGIQFLTGSWEDIKRTAIAEQKIVFIDFYTDWCGPCKMMSSDIFTQDEAGKFFNRHFVNYKINAEKGEGPSKSKQYGVNAYPTFIFITPEGRMIYKFAGSRSVDKLIEEGQKALELYDALPTLDQYKVDYDAGRSDPEFLADYYALLKKIGNGGGAVLNDYLMTIPDKELFVQGRGNDFANISHPDTALYDRILTYMEGLDKNNKDDKNLYSHFTTSTMRSLSTCLRKSIEENDEMTFEMLLGLKKRLGAIDSSVASTLGGGISYLPADQLRLNFYSANGADDKYKRTFERYIQAVQSEMTPDSLDRQRMLIAAASKAGSENKMSGMMIMLVNTQTKILSASLMQGINRYWSLSDDKDASVKQRCTDWYIYLCRLDPSLPMALAAADYFDSIGERSQAESMLEDAIERANMEGGEEVNEGHIMKARERLEKK